MARAFGTRLSVAGRQFSVFGSDVVDFFAKKRPASKRARLHWANCLPHRKRPPQIAAIPTRIQGAIFQNRRQQKSNNASEKLLGESIALVHIG
jgi:hypothetical protein